MFKVLKRNNEDKEVKELKKLIKQLRQRGFIRVKSVRHY